MITKRQSQDLIAISNDPGRYAKLKNDGELLVLVNMGLIRWMETGGYEITSFGRKHLKVYRRENPFVPPKAQEGRE